MRQDASLPGSQAAEPAEERRPERLVTLQPDVLSDAEHALGNLLQRVHHGLGRARVVAGNSLDRLQSSLEDLEALLELVFDYVSPVDVELRPVGAGRVADSLATHLRTHLSAEVQLTSVPAVHLPLDRRLLSRSFELLTRSVWRTELHGASVTRLEVRPEEGSDRVEFAIRAEVTDCPTQRGDHERLALAVATRFIELQGGELSSERTPTVFSCRILLPILRPGDACA